MKDTLPRYTLRVSRELLDKVAYIAHSEGRTKNKEIEHVLLDHVQHYEEENGIILLDSETF